MARISPKVVYIHTKPSSPHPHRDLAQRLLGGPLHARRPLAGGHEFDNRTAGISDADPRELVKSAGAELD